MLAHIVLFDGFDPLDVIAPYEVLFAGGMFAAGALGVELVSAEGPRDVPSETGALSLRATPQLDPRRADLVIVPGASGRLAEDGDATDSGRGDTVPVVLGRTLQTSARTGRRLADRLDRPDGDCGRSTGPYLCCPARTRS